MVGGKRDLWTGGRGWKINEASTGSLRNCACQSMYVHTCRFAVGNNDLGGSGGRKIGRFKMVMEWGKELVKLDRSLFVGDLNRDSFAWKIFTII